MPDLTHFDDNDLLALSATPLGWQRPPPSRRRAIVEWASYLLVDLFRPGRRAYEVIEGGIPPDARVIGVRYDAMRSVWEICLESETYDEVAEFATPPTIRPVVVISEP